MQKKDGHTCHKLEMGFIFVRIYATCLSWKPSKPSGTTTCSAGTRSTVKSFFCPSSSRIKRLRPTPTLVMQTAGTECLHCLI